MLTSMLIHNSLESYRYYICTDLYWCFIHVVLGTGTFFFKLRYLDYFLIFCIQFVEMILYHSLQIRLSLFYFWDGLLLLFLLILCNNLNGLYIHVHVLVWGGGNILRPGFVCQNGKFGTWPGHLLNWTMEHKLFSFVDIFIVRSNSLGRGI